MYAVDVLNQILSTTLLKLWLRVRRLYTLFCKLFCST